MISLWSWIVILLLVVFFGLTQIAGYIGAKRTKRGLYEFYVAGGVLATITVICTYTASYMEAYELVGMPAVIVSWGLQYWMTSMAGYCGLVFLFYTVSLRLYRLGKLHKYITPTDLIVHRVGGFERPLRILVAIMIIYATIFYIGMLYIPAAGVLSAATGGEVPYHLFLLLFVLFIVIYVSVGGMRAVAYADIMAAVCFLPAFIALIYVILTRWGGLINLLWEAYTSEIAPTIYQATLPVQYFLSAILVFGSSWTFIPHLVVRFFAAKRVKSVLQGGLVAYTIFFICGCLWPLIASSAIAAYYGSNLPQVTVVEEYVSRLVRDLFGEGPLLALLLLGLIAIVRSTIDSMLLAAASFVDVDIIEKGLHIKISERIRRLVTTLVIIGIAIASVLIAIYPTAPMVVLSFEFTFPAYSVIAWPIIIMMFWPRANKYGGLASYLAGFISLLLFTYVIWPEYPHNPFGLWAGTLPTLVAVVTLIVVSLLTPPPPKEHLREFYGS